MIEEPSVQLGLGVFLLWIKNKEEREEKERDTNNLTT